ncbi:Na/Pi cotransporter family protein [Candidatus Mycoplasma pogonae]
MEINIQKEGLAFAIFIALAGIALFVYTIKILGNSLKSIAGVRMRRVLRRISDNKFLAVFFGIVITTFIQSSDGAMAIIMGLLVAGLISLRGAIAFLLGANIGTATTSLIVSFQSEFKFTQYFIIFVFIGVFGFLLFKKQNIVQTFLFIFSVGLVFLSLTILGSGVKAITKEAWFENTVKTIGSNNWISYFFSIGFTGLLQSSSATVAIYQKVYEYSAIEAAMNNVPEILSLSSAIALVMGSNVGTTFTGLIIAFLSRDKNSKRIAFIWGFTNFTISIIFVAISQYYADLINMFNLISADKTKGFTLQLSLSHIIFNVILTGIFIWLVRPLEWLSYKLVPIPKIDEKHQISLPEILLESNPLLALASARKSIRNLGNLTQDLLVDLAEFIKKKKASRLPHYLNIEKQIEQDKKAINVYLLKIGNNQLSPKAAEEQSSLIMVVRSLERVAQLSHEIYNELMKVHSKSREIFKIDDELVKELNEMVNLNLVLLKQVLEQITKYDSKRATKIKRMVVEVDEMVIANYKRYVERVKLNSELIMQDLDLEFDYLLVLKTFERVAHRSLRIQKYLKAIRGKSKKPLFSLNTQA